MQIKEIKMPKKYYNAWLTFLKVLDVCFELFSNFYKGQKRIFNQADHFFKISYSETRGYLICTRGLRV
jgi:hypothetical protein